MDLEMLQDNSLQLSHLSQASSRVLMEEEKWETFMAEGVCCWWSLWIAICLGEEKPCPPAIEKGYLMHLGEEIMTLPLLFGE